MLIFDHKHLVIENQHNTPNHSNIYNFYKDVIVKSPELEDKAQRKVKKENPRELSGNYHREL